jgi:beta-galactosidase/beta-glucuronidase
LLAPIIIIMALRLLALALAAAASTCAAAPFPRRTAAASFPHYPSRDVVTLSGLWQFQFVNFTDWQANATALPDLAFKSTQVVPSAWDAHYGTGLEYSRGAGFYKATVSVPANQPAALHFQACSIYCRVFVDGKEVASNTAGGFTPFWADVPPAASSERAVIVMASNVFDTVLTPTQVRLLPPAAAAAAAAAVATLECQHYHTAHAPPPTAHHSDVRRQHTMTSINTAASSGRSRFTSSPRMPRPSRGAETTPFFCKRRLYLKIAIICQDRLGTHTNLKS